jgi:hypothetical protein
MQTRNTTEFIVTLSQFYEGERIRFKTSLRPSKHSSGAQGTRIYEDQESFFTVLRTCLRFTGRALEFAPWKSDRPEQRMSDYYLTPEEAASLGWPLDLNNPAADPRS